MLKQIISSFLMVVLLALAICWSACAKKRGSAFCTSCEKGILLVYEDQVYNDFIRENGDTLNVPDDFTDNFKSPDGVRVCARLKKARIHYAINTHPVYDIKCIRKTD